MKYSLHPQYGRNVRSLGFTLIELLVALGILMAVTAVIISSYGDFNKRQRIVQASLTLKNNLRLAQSKAMSSSVSCAGSYPILQGYRVIVAAADQYTVEYICMDDVSNFASPQNIMTVGLPDEILFESIDIGSTVLFQAPNGKPSANAEFTIYTEGYSVDVMVTAAGDVDTSEVTEV